ncbi:LexA family transcriptional regulator [Microbulbifer sp. 2205BS26-8]|uniref:LexA family protein n=1 Tax=Microbulbifer sp. 2205BS26-8 TaxID=3064386 RepID=UPI00273D8DA5|nr:S24 family peptidase [Microbulbifer sp. 2205BS26-8]MDP5208317.1 S24 family peptidase [Microbulbifer sp. 2205BS26-8]
MKHQLRKRIAARLNLAMRNSPSLSTQAALGKRSGVGQTTIGRILRAEVDARAETLQALAKALGKSVAYFTDSGKPAPGNLIQETPLTYTSDAAARAVYRQVPLISPVKAVTWAETFENGSAQADGEQIPTTTRVGPRAFALKVEGDAMTAPNGLSIPEGYIVVVDPDCDYENGSIVAARLPGDKKVTLKKLVIDGPNQYLKSLNPAYVPIQMNRSGKIIGVAKSVLYDL